MTEDEAKTWLTTALGVSRGTIAALQTLCEKTAEENQKQNLVALSTLNMFWTRHVVDSAQLLPLAGHDWHNWVDLGSGAGFPGLVTALLSAGRVSLVEERRKRAEHLQRMLGVLNLSDRATVIQGRVEQQLGQYDIISARAFAPLGRLFEVAHHLAAPNTIWVLPKGRSATSELEAARITWQGSFRIEPSITDPDGAIIIATGVEPRRRR